MDNKIILEKLDPTGDRIETIELTGRWLIHINDKIYFMSTNYVEEIKVDLEKIQNNFTDNL